MRRQFCNLPVSKRALYMHRLGSVDDVLITDYFNQQRKTATVYYHLDGHFIFKLRSSCSMTGILEDTPHDTDLVGEPDRDLLIFLLISIQYKFNSLLILLCLL